MASTKSGRKNGKDGRTVGYAVVGVGHIAQAAVLPAFPHAENARLVALVSGDEEKREELGRRYGARTYGYDRYEECLASDEVDAVYIATPNTEHAEYTVKAAQAGVHVLCEKPMATCEDDCERMIRACRDHGVKLMIAYRLHFEEANLRAIELVQSGRLGEPRYFASEFGYQVVPGNIRTEWELGGGPLWDLGIYCINASRYLFRAEPLEVMAYGTQSPDPRFKDLYDTVTAVMKFPDQRVASFTCSFRSAVVNSYRVVGTKGDLRVENGYEYALDMEHRLTVDEKTETKTFAKRDQFGPELLYFADCILEGKEPEPSGEEGLMDVRIIEAIHESIHLRASVPIEPIPKSVWPSRAQELYRPPVEEPELVHAQQPSQQ